MKLDPDTMFKLEVINTFEPWCLLSGEIWVAGEKP